MWPLPGGPLQGCWGGLEAWLSQAVFLLCYLALSTPPQASVSLSISWFISS